MCHLPDETLAFQRPSWLRLLARHYFPEALFVAGGLCWLLVNLIYLGLHSYLPEGSWFMDPRVFTAKCVTVIFSTVNLVQLFTTLPRQTVNT